MVEKVGEVKVGEAVKASVLKVSKAKVGEVKVGEVLVRCRLLVRSIAFCNSIQLCRPSSTPTLSKVVVADRIGNMQQETPLLVGNVALLVEGKYQSPHSHCRIHFCKIHLADYRRCRWPICDQWGQPRCLWCSETIGPLATKCAAGDKGEHTRLDGRSDEIFLAFALLAAW